MKFYRCDDTDLFGFAITPSIIYVHQSDLRYLNFAWLWWDYILEWEAKDAE